MNPNVTSPPTATDFQGTLPVANGGTGVTTSTGTGSTVLSDSPTFTTALTANFTIHVGGVQISGAGATPTVGIGHSTGTSISLYASSAELFRADSGGVTYTTGAVQVGGTLGTSATANQFSTASQGASSTAMWIGNAQITAVSDARLKANIVPSTLDSGKLIDALRVDQYVWNDPSDKANAKNANGVIQAGLVAQEVAAVAPWLVAGIQTSCPDCMAGKPCKAGHFLAGTAGPYAHPVIQQPVTTTTPVVDASGTPVLDASGNQMTITKTTIVSSQDDSVTGAARINNEYLLAVAIKEIQSLRARLAAAGVK